MDPFTRLPPEIRNCVLSNLSSFTNISRLTRASPVMLTQYTVSKTSIIRGSLINLMQGHMYDDILQDALAIIHLETGSTLRDGQTIRRHIERWVTKGYPDPFEQRDNTTIVKLYRLLSRLGMFVEDYVSKATSLSPSDACLCLPTITHEGRSVEYRNRMFRPNRVTLDELKYGERQRLLWSFTRYELLCKIHGERVLERMNLVEHKDLVQKLFHSLPSFEKEFVHCVRQYIEDVYGAIFAMSAAVPSPPLPANLTSHAVVPETLLFPDNMYFDAMSAYEDFRESCKDYTEITDLYRKLPAMGFAFLTHVLLYADKAAPADIRASLYSISQAGNRRWWGCTGVFYYYRAPLLEDIDCNSDKSQRCQLLQRLELFQNQRPDGMFVSLEPRYNQFGISTQHCMYRQRAWPFFDDPRLFPGASTQNHFPTMEAINQQDSPLSATLCRQFSGPSHVVRMLRYSRCQTALRDSVNNSNDNGLVIRNNDQINILDMVDRFDL